MANENRKCVVARSTFALMATVYMLNHSIIECKHAAVEKHKGTVKTVKGVDGDVIDCVDIYKQPAFDHPLVKSIQMKPSSYPSGMKPKSSHAKLVQLWHKNGQCPEGTVPIRRTPKHDHDFHHHKRLPTNKTEKPIEGPDGFQHEYATVGTTDNLQYYGAHASINLWNPKTEIDGEFSLSQIWLTNAEQGLNTIEAGWIVYPGRYGNKQARLFVYWTRDGYQRTGCYDLDCPGFVQTNQMYAVGSTITPVSNYEGDVFDLDITIFQDKKSGNWWLQVQGVIFGYWASSIFTGLANSAASQVQWGGEIINTRSYGHHTTTQMGSGHFPYEGPRKSSFFVNLEYVDNSNTLRDSQHLTPYVTDPPCYNLDLTESNTYEYGTYFYYGGPGYSAQCP